MLMKRFLICAAALLPMMSMGAVLTPEQAMARVSKDAAGRAASRAPMKSYTLSRTVEADGAPAIYVMSTPGGERLFVAADDCAMPLLGYTDDVTAELNPSVEAWLSGCCADIAAARRRGGELRMPTFDDTHDIEPLVQTKWGQGEPYNLTTPIRNGVHCPSGCTATAMAQVVNYHRNPKHGIGAIEYQYQSDPEPVTFDFGATEFDYANMLPRYQRGNYTEEQALAVSVLMEACGKAAQAQYWSSETGATELNAQAGLAKYFGLDPGLHIISRFAYPLRQWVRILYEELAAGRPILYSGQTNESGHAFVVDGYSAVDGLFHVNWGWSGGSDGYFLITGLDPGMQGTGGSNGAYNSNQQAIIGVQPPIEGSKEADPIMMLICDWGPQAKTHMRPSGVSFIDMVYDCTLETGGFRVNCRDSVICQLGVRFENLATGEETISWGDNPSMWNNESVYYAHLNYNIGQKKGYKDLPVGEGRYRVTPIVRFGGSDDAEPRDVLVSCGRRQEVTMTVNEFNINVSGPLRPYLDGDDMRVQASLYPGKQFTITANLSARRGEFMGRIHPELAKGTQDVAIYKFDNAMVSCPLDDETPFAWSGKMPADIEPGEYVLRLNDEYSTWICSIGVEVKDAPGDCNVEVDGLTFENVKSGTGDRYDPFVIDDSMMRVRGALKCNSGFFDHTLQFRVMDGFDIVHLFSCGSYFLDAGESAELMFDLAVPSVEADNVYGFRVYERFLSSQGYTTDKQIGNSVYFRMLKQDVVGLDNEAEGIIGVFIRGTLLCASGAARFRVYNALGMSVIDEQCDTVDVSALAAGVYVATATMTDGTTRMLKFCR